MRIFRSAEVPLRPADPSSFTGAAQTKLVAADEQGTPAHVYRVEFESGARTHWHTHSGPQWLFVVEGRVRVQRAGEAAEDLAVGDVVVVAPGEMHWHGASPGSRGVHLAVNVNAVTTWLEPVAETEYRAASGM
jgi:quercetin dioxygenase-like cupin family protein